MTTKNNILSDRTICNIFISKEKINSLEIGKKEGWKVRNSIGGYFNVILKRIDGVDFYFEVTNKDHEQTWIIKRSDLPESLFKRETVLYSQIHWAACECISSSSVSDLKLTFSAFFKGFDLGLKEWFLRFYEKNQSNISTFGPNRVLSELAVNLQD